MYKKHVTVKERNLEKCVELLGFVQDSGSLRKLYKESDIFVLPSDGWAEGSPRTILEAWSVGLPVNATSLGGIPYRIKNGENGLLVEPGEAEALKNGLRNLLMDQALRHKIAKGGVRTVRELSFEHQAKRSKREFKKSTIRSLN